MSDATRLGRWEGIQAALGRGGLVFVTPLRRPANFTIASTTAYKAEVLS